MMPTTNNISFARSFIFLIVITNTLSIVNAFASPNTPLSIISHPTTFTLKSRSYPHLPKLTFRHTQTTTTSLSLSKTTTSLQIPFTIQNVTESNMMDIASFRNDCTSPELMIQKQREKNESFKVDPMKSFFDGLFAGLFFGGILGLFAGWNERSIVVGLQTFGLVGGTSGLMVGINNLTGNRVYIMTLPQAENRLTVDYISSLKTGQDIGFAALVSDLDFNHGKYKPTNGVVACVDCQLRNVMQENGNVVGKKYGTLPMHVYLKNMAVDEDMRRQGIGMALIERVEEYARSVGAGMVTLEVEDSNTSAIRLYEKAGYVAESIANPGAKQKYGSFMIGRSVMMKEL